MRHPLPVLAAAILAASASAQQPTPQPRVTPTSPAPSAVPGLVYDAAFFPGAAYDPQIPTPGSVLGFPVGSRPATHAQIEAVIKALDEASPRARLVEYATSHEGRTLYYLVISSEDHIRNLDGVKTDVGRLADPRGLSEADATRLLDGTPAVAWMAYCIHGDEMSGSDASLALAYHLCASTDQPVKDLLDKTIVIIDPLMNPDGRDRFIKMIAENRTVQPGVDDQSLLHTGAWPYGRTNHYLFDLNRDWILGVHPETRGRVLAAGSWHPQLFMESHEMGSQDTFLFSPPREPINPNLAPTMRKWWDIFSKDHAAAFDRHGWRYYTGEWNEEWYPGYSSSWAGYRGAIDILYEQAAIATDAVRRPEGTLMTYRESVHHQLASSWANISTLAAHRREVLTDYLAQRRAAVAEDGPFAKRTFAVLPSANAARLAGFVDAMRLQGFEVFRAEHAFKAGGRDRLGRELDDREFPEGTILVPNRQPEARLLAAMLEFDTRFSKDFLEEERKELLRFHRSKLYDVTAWNLAMLHDVEGFELATALPEGAKPYAEPASAAAPAANPDQSPTAFVLDGADDRSVAAAGRLMERGVWCRAADKPFRWGNGGAYVRGSILITRADNQNFSGDLAAAVDQAAGELGLAAARAPTGLGPGDEPDIGGEHFILLQPPRIAVLGREPFSSYSYGETWFLLDRVLGVRASFINTPDLGGMDLRRYNVLVVPAGGADAVKERLDTLRDWVKAGGTLIAIGSSVPPIAADKTGIGSTRLLPDVLTKLEDYTVAVMREWEGRNPVIDPDAVWSYAPPAEIKYPWAGDSKPEKIDDDEAKRRDTWREIFMPTGAIVAARVDDRHWLTAGCGDYLPVVAQSGPVLMAASDVQAPIRLGTFVPVTQPPPNPANGRAAPKAGEAASPGAAGKAPAIQPPTTGTPKQPEKKEPDKDAAKQVPEKKDADGDKTDDSKKDESKKPPAPWAPTPAGHELRLRMSGLLWPEAADRLANTAYLTRESVGAGQVILFSSTPTFRGACRGTQRLLSNALILGPGMGTQQPIRP